MSGSPNLKKRKGKTDHTSKEEGARASGTDKPETVVEEVKEVVLEHSRHLRHKQASDTKKLKKKLYQTRRATFVLGTVLGLLLTVAITAYSSDNIKNELDRFINFDSFNDFFEDWRDAMPLGLLQMLDSDKVTSKEELHGSAESFSVGKRMRKEGLESKYNVVMVPGVISTAIESWGTTEDGDCPSISHFRKRMWGSFYMLRTMVLDKTCWLKHIKLDPETGLDPPNIKLRASQGFDSSDFFVTGYWIWNKILQNLAAIGYGPDNMITAAYDWRLAYLDLEKRDGYFSKLKLQLEMNKRLTGEKLYLIGHSMGSQVIMYFMKWVEAEGEYFGNGGPNWCNDYLGGFINISGSLLGTPKTIPALISGEMKDTVQLNYLAVYGLEKFFSKKERVDMIRTFGGVPSMMPKGGDAIWGNLTHSPDDPTNELSTEIEGSKELEGPRDQSFGPFIRYKARRAGRNEAAKIELDQQNFTIALSIDKLLETSPDWFRNRVNEQYSFGLAKTEKELEANNQIPLKWSNPLEVALPNAPDMKIYCFYGVGNPTERAYTYKEDDSGSGLPFVIDTESKHPVFFGDGDGTVSLMTHAICHEWQKKQSRFNPANIEVKVVEIKHEPDRFDIRGGAKTAEHVDILGSAALNELVLRVVSGEGHTINDTYLSELQNIHLKLDL